MENSLQNQEIADESESSSANDIAQVPRPSIKISSKANTSFGKLDRDMKILNSYVKKNLVVKKTINLLDESPAASIRTSIFKTK